MTTKMVANFRRSLSFPNKPTVSPNLPKKTLHVRSVSLPCRSHPLIFQLKDQISDLRIWALKTDNRTSTRVCEGLSRLKTVHESLDDLLQLPQTRELLREHCEWVEKVLEDFLRFVDVYGIFQTLVLTLKQEHLAAQVALRRRDDSKTVLYVKALKKMSKEMGKLISTLRSIGKCSIPEHKGDAEIDEIISDVNEVTILVSLALFGGIYSSFSVQKSTWKGLRLPKKEKKMRIEESIQELEQVGVGRLWGLIKKGDEEVKMVVKKMYEMEDCLCGIECGAEKLFRSLIQSRVSMLNVLTQ